MKENLLVTLADKNYINQAKQLFSSVYWKAGWKGDYMLLAHEIPEKDLKWFRDKGILIKKCKPLYNKKIGEFPPVVLDKFYLFTPEFKKWKNIVYLDADIIVRASLDKLTKVKNFSVCSDPLPLAEQFNFSFGQFEKSFDLNGRAFNSGLIAFSSDIICLDIFAKLKKLFSEYKLFCKTGEQPLLNLYFYKKWEKLPSFYNLYVNYIDSSKNLSIKKNRGVVLHFAKIIYAPVLWENINPFYNEWKINLEKAEFINLNKLQKSKKYPQLIVFINSLALKLRYLSFKLKIKHKLKLLISYILCFFNRFIGKIGICLKKRNSDLYYKLKKII